MSSYPPCLRRTCNVIALILVAILGTGCSAFSGNREVPLSMVAKQAIEARVDGMQAPVGLVNDGSDKVVTVFFAFDGTLNDKDDTPKGEDTTVVAKLYETVEAPLIDSEKARNARVAKHYEKGPGCFGSIACWLDAAFGTSGIEIAQRALGKLKDFTKIQGNSTRELRIVVTGFSRGAAIARHFLNLAYKAWRAGELHGNIEDVWSYALLFDTVATGQTETLTLAFPPNLDLAFHYLAENEARGLFEPIVDDESDFENASRALGTGLMDSQRVFTIYVPGSHSDLGDSYLSGAGPLITAFAKRTLLRMGLHKQGVISACTDRLPGNGLHCSRTLDEGLHDSRGLWDHLTLTSSPYACGFKRRIAEIVKVSLTREDAARLAKQIRKRRHDMFANNMSEVRQMPMTGNYVFDAIQGAQSWTIVYPSVQGFNELPAIVSGNPNTPLLTLTTYYNSGINFAVPSYVIDEVKRLGGRASVERNVLKGSEPWWFVNSCLPNE